MEEINPDNHFQSIALLFDRNGKYVELTRLHSEEEMREMLNQQEYLGYKMKIYTFKESWVSKIALISKFEEMASEKYSL